MIDYQPLLQWMQEAPKLRPWLQELPTQIEAGLSPDRFGDLPTWLEALDALPKLDYANVNLQDSVTISHPQLSAIEHSQIEQQLQALIPWRKGPYFVNNTHLDTEWRSDWKWNRVKQHLGDLTGQLILDVGCGNGYHCWRMLGAGAQRVIGIDPSPRFVVQWAMMRKLMASDLPVDVLPVGIEALPTNLKAFDTVFSMGVLYHRKSPLEHLRELKECTVAGGQVVLETLVVDGDLGYSLVPEGRYGKMPNVWFLPSTATLLSWMRKVGLRNPRLVDLDVTSTEEQRTTPWMKFESLADFLDPDDPSKTVEGHPAPQRAVIIAEA